LTRIREFMLGAADFDSFDDAVEYVQSHDPSRDPAKLRHTLKHSLRQLPDGRWTWKRDQRHLDDRYFAEALKELRSLLPVVGDIRCPTLVVRGENGVLGAEDADNFCSRLPHGRAVTVEGAGHNIQSDNPAGLVAALRPFLAETTPDEYQD
jgi:pimeloyl-ACP methyl ester carboxylesterase